MRSPFCNLTELMRAIKLLVARSDTFSIIHVNGVRTSTCKGSKLRHKETAC